MKLFVFCTSRLVCMHFIVIVEEPLKVIKKILVGFLTFKSTDMAFLFLDGNSLTFYNF